MSKWKIQNKNAEPWSAYHTIILLGALLWNEAVYYCARLLAGSRPHYVLETPQDQWIPVLPWSVAVYFGCFLFWGVNYWLCARQSREKSERFFCADAMAKTICFFIFLVLPTTNCRPEITGADLWSELLRLLYRIDAPDNLFPSIHCLVSWLCWVGVRGRTDLPKAYRWFSFVAAIAVCLSTLTTRQHVIVDVAGGIVLAELCYWLCGYPAVRGVYGRMVDAIAGWFCRK